MAHEEHLLDCDGDTIRLQLEPRRHYLFAHVDGASNGLATSLRYWRELAQICMQRGIERLMVVDALDGPPMSLPDLGSLISAMAGSPLRRIRIAFVEPVATHLPMMEHGQILAQEHGFEAGVFASQLAGERWLLYGGESEGKD
jgi:hypothetical protein